MSSRIIVTKLRLYGQSKKFSSQVKADGQPTMVDILLNLQKVLVPCDLLKQLARVRRVELDTEVECERLHAFDLSVDLLVGVEPMRLRQVVDEAKTKVCSFQQVQVLVNDIQKILASGSVLYLLYELSFVQEDHFAVEGLGFLAEAALHGEITRRLVVSRQQRCSGGLREQIPQEGRQECDDASSEEEQHTSNPDSRQ